MAFPYKRIAGAYASELPENCTERPLPVHIDIDCRAILNARQIFELAVYTAIPGGGLWTYTNRFGKWGDPLMKRTHACQWCALDLKAKAEQAVAT